MRLATYIAIESLIISVILKLKNKPKNSQIYIELKSPW